MGPDGVEVSCSLSASSEDGVVLPAQFRQPAFGHPGLTCLLLFHPTHLPGSPPR